MKKCCRCKEFKSLTSFGIENRSKDGFRGICKNCFCKYWKEYLIKHPKVAQKCKVNALKWKHKNKDRLKKRYILNKDKLIKNVNKYNQTKDSGLLYKYLSMRRRCNNPSQDAYKYYGGKGIKVEWKSYQEFKKDMLVSYLKHLEEFGKKETTLERINNIRNYSKKNCRWATRIEQARNKSNSIAKK